MENLISRSRASMNLIGISALLLVWICSQSSINVKELGLKVYNLTSLIEEDTLPLEITKFRDEVLIKTSGGEELEDVLLEFQVSRIIKFLDLKFISKESLEKQEVSDNVSELLRNTMLEAANSTSNSDPQERLYNMLDTIVIYRNADELRITIGVLRKEFVRMNLSDESTLADLEKALRGEITLPIIGQKVEQGQAKIALLSFLILPLLYLLSVVRAIDEEIEYLNERKATDWIFFHPDKLGFILGSLWVLSPALAVLWAIYLGNFSIKLGIPVSFLLGIISFYILNAIRLTRLKYSSRLKKLNKLV